MKHIFEKGINGHRLPYFCQENVSNSAKSSLAFLCVKLLLDVSWPGLHDPAPPACIPCQWNVSKGNECHFCDGVIKSRASTPFSPVFQLHSKGFEALGNSRVRTQKKPEFLIHFMEKSSQKIKNSMLDYVLKSTNSIR